MPIEESRVTLLLIGLSWQLWPGSFIFSNSGGNIRSLEALKLNSYDVAKRGPILGSSSYRLPFIKHVFVNANACSSLAEELKIHFVDSKMMMKLIKMNAE